MKTILFILALLVASPALADWHPGPHGWHGDWHQDWGWHHDSGAGAGFLGGLIGGAIGSIFAQPPATTVVTPTWSPPPGPQPGTPAWFAYCANKYRTFNPATGTFVGFDGLHHPCQ